MSARSGSFSVGGRQLSYRLDSRCFILRAAGRAIGLGFFTYDHASNLIFCNHVGIGRAWRGGGLARASYREMVGMLDELFPRNIGVVLEVEPFDRDRVAAIIGELERTGRRPLAADEQDEIRRLLRARWYDKLGYAVFCDAKTMQPLPCRSPCLDPCLLSSDWAAGEENYWLMWQARTGAPSADECASEFWQHAVAAIYVEILAKSLVDDDPDGRRDYWDYATALVARTMQQTATTDMRLARCLGDEDGALLSRWRRLAIDLSIYRAEPRRARSAARRCHRRNIRGSCSARSGPRARARVRRGCGCRRNARERLQHQFPLDFVDGRADQQWDDFIWSQRRQQSFRRRYGGRVRHELLPINARLVDEAETSRTNYPVNPRCAGLVNKSLTSR